LADQKSRGNIVNEDDVTLFVHRPNVSLEAKSDELALCVVDLKSNIEYFRLLCCEVVVVLLDELAKIWHFDRISLFSIVELSQAVQLELVQLRFQE